MKVTLLAGGYGGAKMAHGFAQLDDVELAVVGNTADDFELHGLHISPDLDTLMYTLADIANPQTGWGVRDETWSASAMLERYGQPTWFRLGDRDLATHVLRTARLRAGVRLTEVTDFLRRRLAVRASLLPVTDDRLRTRVRTAEGWLDFQDWFVRRRHADEVLELEFTGADSARVTDEVLAAIARADLLVIAPSNPFVSIGPMLAVPGVLPALLDAAAPVVAVSPIVGGAALRGPADQMLRSLARDAGAGGVARLYANGYPGLVDALVIDEQDSAIAAGIEQGGCRAVVASIVMRNEADRRDLAAAMIARFAG